ncbi:helix-turn-helix transcriptional regulator [Solibacillus sp. FSL R5-0449]|uniref:helix-turn-helix domain-containing protein n=1 Tax=Solibacillus sp. FSL R5-0449 TaxID=2921639 RepID=UPI0030CC48D8
MGIGDTLKKIRLNRNMTQNQVAEGVVNQGTYSRIERNQLQVDVELLEKLLQKFNISSNEFFYVYNNYSATEQQTIMQEFRDLAIVSPDLLKIKIDRLENFLAKTPSTNLNKIHSAYQILFHYINGVENEKNQAQAMVIWEEFQRLDNWYIDDLILLNSLLFLLPLEIAEDITKTALQRIRKYKEYEKDLTYLEIYFQMDLSVMYIEHQHYDIALHKLNYLEQTYKQKMNYQTLAGLFFNKSICYLFLNEQYDEEFSKVKILLEIYDDQALLNMLLQNFEELQCQLEFRLYNPSSL